MRRIYKISILVDVDVDELQKTDRYEGQGGTGVFVEDVREALKNRAAEYMGSGGRVVISAVTEAGELR